MTRRSIVIEPDDIAPPQIIDKKEPELNYSLGTSMPAATLPATQDKPLWGPSPIGKLFSQLKINVDPAIGDDHTYYMIGTDQMVMGPKMAALIKADK